jgi:hypothetical protein
VKLDALAQLRESIQLHRAADEVQPPRGRAPLPQPLVPCHPGDAARPVQAQDILPGVM